MIHLSPTRAAQYLISQLALAQDWPGQGASAAQALLAHLRCIQLDPLSAVGTNADLVWMARSPTARAGQLHGLLYPGAFEHFAKERCVLPAAAFPAYRQRALQAPEWRLTARLKRLPEAVMEHVLEEVRAKGPLTAAALSDRGKVQALDWSGWKGTSKASKMALDVLWTRCQVVVCGRRGREKIYDIPERALSPWTEVSPEEANTTMLLDRVEAAGLLCFATGPQWGGLQDARKQGLPAKLIQQKRLVEVKIQGSTRSYLAPADFLERQIVPMDDKMRLLGPLDPLIWDRKLTQSVFDFTYIWEVYKPAAKRRWGWYVCPLLHKGRLVGRLEGHRHEDTLVIDTIWPEPGVPLDLDALDDLLQRHALAMGLQGFARPAVSTLAQAPVVGLRDLCHDGPWRVDKLHPLSTSQQRDQEEHS